MVREKNGGSSHSMTHKSLKCQLIEDTCENKH